ncbi:MAG: hypothetical protein AAF483_27615 [Planctomycetota bacterium]
MNKHLHKERRHKALRRELAEKFSSFELRLCCTSEPRGLALLFLFLAVVFTTTLPRLRAEDNSLRAGPKQFSTESSGEGSGQDSQGSLDSIWEVNARALPAETILNPVPRMRFRRAFQTGWQEYDALSFVSDCEACERLRPRKTIVYVHGNWTSQRDAQERGLTIYDKIRSTISEPIQFIIYSWASDRVSGLTKDVRRKRERLNGESYYLSQVLRFVDPDSSLSLIGFSFGTGVACGFLQLEAGGELGGIRLISNKPRQEVNLMFLAAAFDRADLESGRQYGHALDQVDRLVNLYNSVDPALKRFRILDRKAEPIAAGFAGVPPTRTQANTRYYQIDCTHMVGRSHSELAYIRQCTAFDQSLPSLLGL